jgi:hypothetical protein
MRWASWILLIWGVPDFPMSANLGRHRPIKNTSYVRQQGPSAGDLLL